MLTVAISLTAQAAEMGSAGATPPANGSSPSTTRAVRSAPGKSTSAPAVSRTGARPSTAATKSTVGKPNNGVAAIVRTDGAMVYDKADFDANVLTNLHEGDRVRVSSGTVGDYAKFHKVRAGSVVGWIADIDVQVEGAAKKRDQRRGAGPRSGKKKKEKKPFSDESMPILFTKYVGVVVGVSDFNEDISGVDSKSSQLTYGLKITGPDTLFTGPITDFNVVLHYGAPAYYNSLSTTPPKGFFITADALLLYPFFNRDRSIITFGLGPLVKFSSFQVTNGGEPRSLSELDVGVSLSLSGAMKFGKIAVRLEGKYEIEKHSSKVFQFALQQEFK